MFSVNRHYRFNIVVCQFVKRKKWISSINQMIEGQNRKNRGIITGKSREIRWTIKGKSWEICRRIAEKVTKFVKRVQEKNHEIHWAIPKKKSWNSWNDCSEIRWMIMILFHILWGFLEKEFQLQCFSLP